MERRDLGLNEIARAQLRNSIVQESRRPQRPLQGILTDGNLSPGGDPPLGPAGKDYESLVFDDANSQSTNPRVKKLLCPQRPLKEIPLAEMMKHKENAITRRNWASSVSDSKSTRKCANATLIPCSRHAFAFSLKMTLGVNLAEVFSFSNLKRGSATRTAPPQLLIQISTCPPSGEVDMQFPDKNSMRLSKRFAIAEPRK